MGIWRRSDQLLVYDFTIINKIGFCECSLWDDYEKNHTVSCFINIYYHLLEI